MWQCLNGHDCTLLTSLLSMQNWKRLFEALSSTLPASKKSYNTTPVMAAFIIENSLAIYINNQTCNLEATIIKRTKANFMYNAVSFWQYESCRLYHPPQLRQPTHTKKIPFQAQLGLDHQQKMQPGCNNCMNKTKANSHTNAVCFWQHEPY